ncbi:MAG TPA: sulfotransferase, partial [Rhodanobacteraceae bacterium]|nr:sulfotransferase [Rhodanobacteraceae bacterium]
TLLWHGVTRAPPVFARLARDYVRRLDARGLRGAFEPVRSELADPQDYRLELAAERRWAAMPDAALVAAPAPCFVHAHGRFRAGIGIGEWERVPESWARAANTLDRLIVPDEFQAEAFRSAGVRKPIAIVPFGVDRDYLHPQVPAPRHPRGHFVFLAIAEDLARDAPERLVEAFGRTFDADEPVELLIRLIPDRDAAMATTLATLIGKMRGASIRLLHGWTFPDHERALLLAAADAYVSVRRGGGWDPHAADALALGRTLIAGDFGSSAALARAHGHLVAAARRVEDEKHPGCRWAEPDPDSFGDALRRAFDARKDAATARAAATTFAAAHDIEASADRLLGEIAHGGTLAPKRTPVPAHRPDEQGRSASGQIIVLGMHRSGTSSVAGLLARLGAWPGDDSALLIGPDNPRGHYELAALHDACRRRLDAAGGDWKRPPAASPPQAIDAFRREAAAVLDTLDAHRPWFVKEPRLCLLVRELLPLLTRPVFVHVVRDPIEVAASLAARDGLDRAQALSLWAHYTRSEFAATHGWPRVLVDYADMLANPARVAMRLGAELGAFGIEGLRAPDDAAIGEWIEPDLRRQRAQDADRDMLTASQRDLAAAIADRSVLEREFAEERAPFGAPPAAEAASRHAYG